MYKIEAFGQGESFHWAANSIIPDNWPDNEDDDGYWFIPSIVNKAFACELYLKSLLSNGNSQTKGHNLYELFVDLPQNLKDSIINSADFCGDDEFMSQLEIHKQTFQDWRYLFEHKSVQVNLTFIDKLAETLHDLAEQECINTGWKRE